MIWQFFRKHFNAHPDPGPHQAKFGSESKGGKQLNKKNAQTDDNKSFTSDKCYDKSRKIKERQQKV